VRLWQWQSFSCGCLLVSFMTLQVMKLHFVFATVEEDLMSFYSRCILLFLSVFTSAFAARADNQKCSRIISLAPSVTEVVFALGLGDNLVGVTRYCSYPPKAESIPKIGALLDTNFEAILQAKPDMLAYPAEHKAMPEFASRFEVLAIAMDHRSVDGIIASTLALGQACGKKKEAATLVSEWRSEVQRLTKKYQDKKQISVLVAVARESLDVATSAVYLSGRDGFYNELLQYLGAKNVFENATVAAASLSPEAFLSLKPDVIIEMAPESIARGWSKEQIVSSWQRLPGLEDISLVAKEPQKEGVPRLGIITQDFADIPGPRFLLLLRELEKLLRGRGLQSAKNRCNPRSF
jgi:iron complex transport system substrate-binding protein